MKNSRNKAFWCLTLSIFAGGLIHAAQVDIGLTTGRVSNGTSFLNGAALRVGVFSGYNDTLGSSFFTGKTYTDLTTAFTALVEMNSAPEVTTSGGQFYLSYDTASNAAGTRLFAWLYSTTTPQAVSNWAIISGGGNPTGPSASTFDPNWLAVAPAAIDVNIVEMGNIYSKIYASSGPGIILSPSTAFDPEGANIVLIPEPSSGGLLVMSAALALSRRRKK